MQQLSDFAAVANDSEAIGDLVVVNLWKFQELHKCGVFRQFCETWVITARAVMPIAPKVTSSATDRQVPGMEFAECSIVRMDRFCRARNGGFTCGAVQNGVFSVAFNRVPK